MNAKNHYDQHLGNFYSWMVGDFDEKQKQQEDFFLRNDIKPVSRKVAFDLGAGNGLQAISLAKLGFAVKAIDFNAQLLNELTSRKSNLNIEIINDDILTYLQRSSYQAELMICMGDTITHLESIDRVALLVQQMSSHLEPGGKIVVSFRDLTKELQGDERFIPVKNDDSRILTCFLEYFPDRVMVHDILHEKQGGKWIQKVGYYPKLRLDVALLTDLLQKNDIQLLTSEIVNGMIYLIGKKGGDIGEVIR
jgi:SAM-dependent methyltransferase